MSIMRVVNRQMQLMYSATVNLPVSFRCQVVYLGLHAPWERVVNRQMQLIPHTSIVLISMS